MFNVHSYANSAPTGAGYLEILTRQNGATDSPSNQVLFMPLKGSVLAGSVAGPLARLVLEQRFAHPDRESGPVLEAVYRFPLPGDAAVTAVRVQFGDTEITTELADRNNAERAYDEARTSGHQAALLTRESPDVFSLHISGIQSGEDVRVRTEFVLQARPAGAGFSMRVPLTPAPRYVGQHARGRRHAGGQPLGIAHDPGHRFSLDLDFRGVATISSRTHQLDISSPDEITRVALQGGDVVPDRDLVIEWQMPDPADRPGVQAWTYIDAEDEEPGSEYFLTLITPPSNPESTATHRREVVLLVDRSGSMSGPKWEAADWAVRRFLSGLTPEDHFSLGLFHSTTRWFSRSCVPANGANLQAAQRFIDAHQDSGGTELEHALTEALATDRSTVDASRHVVIITDAQVGRSDLLLDLARSEASRADRRRISVVCIDAAPNSHLVHELTGIGAGRAVFLTSDPEAGDITTALDEILRFWDAPIETDLKLVVNRSGAWVMGREAEGDHDGDAGVRLSIGDLPAGQPVWIVGRTEPGDEPLQLVLQRTDHTELDRTHAVQEGDVVLRALFGARRLLALEYRLESLASPWTHRGGLDSESHQKLRQLLVNESLRYGIACSETAFVAVRQEAGKLVERGAIVPNAVPHGWEHPDVMYSYGPVDFAVASMAEPLELGAAEERADSGPLADRAAYRASPAYERRLDRRASGPRFSKSSRMDYSRTLEVFSGVLRQDGESTTIYQVDEFGRNCRLKSLTITVQDDDAGAFNGTLELFVGDDVEPKARVQIGDILAQGGTRPLNVLVGKWQSVRLELSGVPDGVDSPPVSITVEWESL